MTDPLPTPTATEPAPPAPPPSHARPLSLLLLTALLAVAIYLRFPYLNGPWYFTWSWQRTIPALFFPCMIAAGLPTLLAVAIYQHNPRRRPLSLALLLLSAAALMLTLSFLEPRLHGLERTSRIVISPGATSYYANARQFLGPQSPLSLRYFLAHYPDLQSEFYVHAQTKPPGPMLYHAAFIAIFGPGTASAVAAGLGLGALALLSILATEWMVRRVTGNHDAALLAAAFLALSPGFIAFYPSFDGVYPALACLMIGTWILALRTGRARYALAYGAALTAALFFTYVLLLLGAFLAAYSLAALRLVPGCTLKRILRQTVLAVAVVAVVYALMWLFTGYNAVATFRECKFLADAQLRWVHRPYPLTIGWDLYDFALGSGFLPALLLFLFLARLPRSTGPELWVIALLCLLEPILVAITGRVPGETARVWQLLLPLLFLPASLELARWDKTARLTTLLCLLALLLIITGRMTFVETESVAKLHEMGLL